MKLSKNLIYSVFILLFYCSGNNNGSFLEGTGTVEAVHVDIGSPVAGKVANIFVEEGEQVQQGDILLKIDDTDLLIQHKLAKGKFNAASAQLKLVLAGAREEDIQRAQENVKGAKAAFDKAETNFKRLKNLYEKGSATKALLDDASAGFEVAQANYQASRKMLEKLVKGARLEEVEMAQANKSIAEANLELIEKRISDCSITSPLNGTVTHKLVEAGERVLPNGIVTTITKTDSMWITVYISDKNIGKVKIGQEAEIKIDSFEDRAFPGYVTFIAEEAEFTPKNIQTKDEREKLVFGVKIKISNDDGSLKAGLPADVILKIQ